MPIRSGNHEESPKLRCLSGIEEGMARRSRSGTGEKKRFTSSALAAGSDVMPFGAEVSSFTKSFCWPALRRLSSVACQGIYCSARNSPHIGARNFYCLHLVDQM